jgi:hypothetical protein
MFLRLSTPAFVRGDHEQDESDGPDAGEHVGDEAFVPRHVDESHLATGGKLAPGIPEVDREAPPLLLLPSIGVHPGEADDQRRLAVIDVAGRGHDAELRHLSDDVLVGDVADAMAAVVVAFVPVEVVPVFLVAFERVVDRSRQVRDLRVRHGPAIQQDEPVLDP